MTLPIPPTIQGQIRRRSAWICSTVTSPRNGLNSKTSAEAGVSVTSKLIGSVSVTETGIDAYVRPEMVPLSHPLAGIMGDTNALTFHTDLLGDVTVVGPGAGRLETGFSILTDLISLAGNRI